MTFTTPSPSGQATHLRPFVLTANQPSERPYRGGSGIARFRDAPHLNPYTPEDFVASTTEVFSGNGIGLTVLADGRTLRDAVANDPLGFLGADHVREFGVNTMLLVKLLSTDERLFVHYHPDAAFATEHLGQSRGKTEAWIILDTDGRDDAYALLGFNRPIPKAEVEGWIVNQDVPQMLTAMNRVPLRTGDTLLVPAGLPHAIGPGVTLIELQEPTDLSILLEYKGFPGFTQSIALLGLDLQTAIAGLETARWDAEQIATLASSDRTDDSGVARQLFPAAADSFFSAWQLDVQASHSVAPGFSVLVVTDGSGILRSGSYDLEIGLGMTVLIPYGAGEVSLVGQMKAILCAPPTVPGRDVPTQRPKTFTLD
jgi:mannose-6-phosphate isomerase